MAIVTTDELRDFMSGITLTPPQVAAAELLIAGVQAEVETEINRSLEPVERVEVVTPDYRGNVWPLHTPIVSVTSVQSGSPLGDVSYDFADGVLNVGVGEAVTLTYVGGIGLEHRAYNHLKLEVLRIIAREMTNRHDDTLGIKDLDANDEADPGPNGITDDDKKRFKRWKRRVVV